MVELVHPTVIEGIVGVKRHATEHRGRAITTEMTVYILHSQECKDSGIDLRECEYSHALAKGIYEVPDWEWMSDKPVTLSILNNSGVLYPESEAL